MENNHMNSAAYQQEEDISLMDLLLVLAKHNRFIIRSTLGAAAVAIVASLIMQNIYTAKTVILPPQQTSASTSMLLGQLGGLAGAAGGRSASRTPAIPSSACSRAEAWLTA